MLFDTVAASTFGIENWLIILSTLIGPILAVQVQKWLEHYRARRDKQHAVFEALMGARAAVLSREFVHALNRIDIAFSPAGRFLSKETTRKEKAVCQAWRELMNSYERQPNPGEEQLVASERYENLISLLCKMSECLGYEFDKVYMKKNHYMPAAHGLVDGEVNELRQRILDLLRGENPLKMEVSSLPMDRDAYTKQLQVWDRVIEALGGSRGALNVRLEEQPPPEGSEERRFYDIRKFQV